MIDLSIQLDAAREATIGDISVLHEAIALLPTTLEPNAESCQALDNLQAIIFHLAFPLRERESIQWFAENYIGADIPNDGKGLALLERLGLLRKPEPIRRRV